MDSKHRGTVVSECVKESHQPGKWQTEGNIQVRRCKICNLIVVTTTMPPESSWIGPDGGCRVS